MNNAPVESPRRTQVERVFVLAPWRDFDGITPTWG